MNWDQDIHTRCANLRHQNATLRARAAAVRGLCARIEQRAEVQAAPTVVEPAAPNPHDAAMDVLRAIRARLDELPLAWQIAVVKALTARTLVKAYERTRAAPTALSA